TIPDHRLSLTIWNFLQVGISPEPWLGRLLPEVAERVEGAPCDIAFWLLWNVLQASPSLCSKIALTSIEKLRSRIMAEPNPTLVSPLIGLLKDIGCDVTTRFLRSEEHKVGETLISTEDA